MRQQPSPAGGFTLIELLVVLVILGSLIGIAVLSVGIAGPGRELHNEAERLAGLIGVLAEDAVLDNQEYGLLLSREAYQVLRTYQRERDVQTSQRFSAGIRQVTGDIQEQLDRRRQQLDTARANTELQRTVIRWQNWIVGIGVVFMLSALLTLLWQ